jgi:hypothetical protein
VPRPPPAHRIVGCRRKRRDPALDSGMLHEFRIADPIEQAEQTLPVQSHSPGRIYPATARRHPAFLRCRLLPPSASYKQAHGAGCSRGYGKRTAPNPRELGIFPSIMRPGYAVDETWFYGNPGRCRGTLSAARLVYMYRKAVHTVCSCTLTTGTPNSGMRRIHCAATGWAKNV